MTLTTDRAVPRERLERFGRMLGEYRRREERKLQSQRGWIDEDGVLQGGLMAFIRYHWRVLEPKTELIEGWALYAIMLHLEAVTFGEITRLLVNVPPGFMKSLTADVFWPAWEAGPMGMPDLRYVSFSYASPLTERDNERFRDLLLSVEYRHLWGSVFRLRKVGSQKVTNDKTGWKFASSVGGVGTGERGDRIICFPADATVLTDCGWIEIGEIVRRKTPVLIAGYDEKCDAIKWQVVSDFEANPASDLVEVVHDFGVLRCTPDHPIFVDGRGYVAAANLSPGDALRTLRQGHSSQAERPAEILLQNMSEYGGLRGRQEGEQSSLQKLRQDGLPIAGPFGAHPSRPLLQPRLPRRFQRWEKQSSLPRWSEKICLRQVWERATAEGKRSKPAELLLKVLCLASQVGRKLKEDGGAFLSNLRQALQEAPSPAHLLFSEVREYPALKARQGHRQWPLRSRRSAETLPARLEQETQERDTGAGRGPVPAVPNAQRFSGPSRSPYRLCEGKSGAVEPDHVVQEVSRANAWQCGAACGMEISVVRSVRVSGHASATFNLRAWPHHNYFADGVLVHNCDDPHNVKDGESETVRSETVRWFRESMSNRLNDQEFGAIVIIMQRVHEDDVSGIVLESGMEYVHLMIPMEYDSSRHCETAIGWSDPRSEDGELAWPERFSPETVAQLKVDLGPYAFASQYAQEPAPRGGGIFQRAWWQIWEPGSEEAKAVAKHEDGRWPPFEYVVGSLDGAYTEKEENDPTAMTVWGVFRDKLDHPKIALVHAWRKRLILHGPVMPQVPGESRLRYLKRVQPHWGVVEWAAHTCRTLKIDVLLIEAKASGISTAQSIQSLYGDEGFATQLVQVKGDKVARAQAVVPFFSNHMVYAPAAPKEDMPSDILLFRDWAQMVVDEMAVFPKGRYDDLTDTASMALRHLRIAGFARLEAEVETDKSNAMRYRPNSRPLYPGSRV